MRRWEKCLVPSSSLPYRPSRSLLQELYRISDGRLRLRWSQRFEKWAVEEQVRRPISYVSNLPRYQRRWITAHDFLVVENDEWVRARDGYSLVGHLHPQPRLSDWMIRNLRYYDLRRFSGGWKDAEREVLEFEARQAQQRDANHQQRRIDISNDFYEREQWRQGEKSVVPRSYSC